MVASHITQLKRNPEKRKESLPWQREMIPSWVFPLKRKRKREDDRPVPIVVVVEVAFEGIELQLLIRFDKRASPSSWKCHSLLNLVVP